MAEVTLNLPHRGAELSDRRGRKPKPLTGGGPTYRFPVQPQQIVTIRFRAESGADEIKPVTAWDKFVYHQSKRGALHAYGDYKGHPPRGMNRRFDCSSGAGALLKPKSPARPRQSRGARSRACARGHWVS